MGKVTITLDTPGGIDPSIVEEIFKLKVDKEKFKERLKEIEKIAKRIRKPKEDPLKVLMEIRE
ncbi:hypothetical protein DRP07_10235 [Archaeoglobales archaeon]|nr:MAG: hypothetical protein DRP07_10235 [Archaeoglobales archaeon]